MRYMDIVEGQAKVIYHGTSTHAAARIIADGRLNAGVPDDYDAVAGGISFTTDRGVAETFAHSVDERDAEMEMECFVGGPRLDLPHAVRGAIFVFDRAIVARFHRIVAHAWDGSNAEREERVVGETMGLKGLVRIDLSRASMEAWIAFYISQEEPESAEPIHALAKHPLVRLR